MNRYFAILFFIIVFNSLFSQNLIEGLSGSGAESDPVKIYTISDLRIVSAFVMNDVDYSTATLGKHFTLMNDVNFNDLDENENLIYDLDGDGINESNFIPIGGRKSATEASDYRCFQGIFNACGNSIKNMKIIYAPFSNGDDLIEDYFGEGLANYVGLFGLTWGAEIKLLLLNTCLITGKGCVGALVGQLNGGSSIEQCVVTESRVYGSDMYVGGLCGATYANSKINNCYTNFCEILGNNFVGGFCGNNNNNSKISNCYVLNEVVTLNNSSYYGPFCGYNTGSAIIENCFYHEEWEASGSAEPGIFSLFGTEISEDEILDDNFVNILNNEQDSVIWSDIPEAMSVAIWHKDTYDINREYPILWWQCDFTINLQKKIFDEIAIYPNPAKDIINVNINKKLTNGKIELFDITGKLFYEKAISDNNNIINVNRLKSGIYFVKLSENNLILDFQKIIIQK
jgi:hypothetical protein